MSCGTFSLFRQHAGDRRWGAPTSPLGGVAPRPSRAEKGGHASPAPTLRAPEGESYCAAAAPTREPAPLKAPRSDLAQ